MKQNRGANKYSDTNTKNTIKQKAQTNNNNKNASTHKKQGRHHIGTKKEHHKNTRPQKHKNSD